MIVACYHPSACMLHFDLVSLLFGTLIPTSVNILVKMFYTKSLENVRSYSYIHVCGCRLDHKGNAKVGDFGLAEDIYARGYVREDSKTVKVPYKWMPPESLEDGLFSEHSDVVCCAELRIQDSMK